MSNNSRMPATVLGIIAALCLGGCVVLWAKWKAADDDLRTVSRRSESALTGLQKQLEDAKRRAKESVKPIEVDEPLVTESELEAIQTRLRESEQELEKVKERNKFVVEKWEAQQKGMRASAKLQGELRQQVRDAATEKSAWLKEKAALESKIKNLRATISKLQRQLKAKTKIDPPKIGGGGKGIAPSTGTGETEGSSGGDDSEPAPLTLIDWLRGHLKNNEASTPGSIGEQLSTDDHIATALAVLMDDPDLCVAALHYARYSKWWTLDRVLKRASRGLPETPEVVKLLGDLLFERCSSENRDFTALQLRDGILGAAWVGRLSRMTRPVAPVDIFLRLLESEDAGVVSQARQALSQPVRRGSLVTAIVERRAAGHPLEPSLEALAWENLEETVATAACLAQADKDISAKLRAHVSAWAVGRPEEVRRRVLMELLALTVRGSDGEKKAWGDLIATLLPEAGSDTAGFLARLEGEEPQPTLAVLAAPAFGAASTDSALFLARKREASLARQLYDTTLGPVRLEAVFRQMMAVKQPLFVPLIEAGLSRVSASAALDMAAHLYENGRPSALAWFKNSLETEFERRMATVEKLFDLGTDETHALARIVVGNGDPRATFRLVELGWERNVPMPQESIEMLLRSKYLDPIRIDVFMAYFRSCVGDKLEELVTEALFDPSGERPETLLDFFDGKGDQNLMPLILRYLESERAIVREAALRALVGLDLNGLADRLVPFVRDPEKMVRIQAARCLGTMGGDPIARGGLLVLCRDEREFVREAAVEALAFHKKDKLIPALRFAVGDAVPEVAVAAARSLIEIGEGEDKTWDLLFRSVEDTWLGPGTRKFLKQKLGVDFATRDEWRAWWAINGQK